MKIAFVSGKLTGGGSERAVSEMANYWAGRGHTVTVITYLEESGSDDYPLDAAVSRISAFPRFAWRLPLPLPLRVLPRLFRLRRAIRGAAPDVVISMILGANLSTLIATAGMSLHVIGQQVNAIESSLSKRYMRLLQQFLYRRLDGFVVQSRQLFEMASRLVSPEKIRVIPRHVSPAFATDDAPRSTSRWQQLGNGPSARIVAMGRLVPQKGFDLLLGAVARLPREIDYGLVVMGDGEERSTLEQIARRFGVDERVWLFGWTKDPRPTLLDSTVFVLPSRWEGWPNALLQAMALGLPVVAADCRTGPGEIITDGVDGLLVPPDDVDALAAAIQRLVHDAGLRERLGTAAREVRNRFAMDQIMSMWEELFPARVSVR